MSRSPELADADAASRPQVALPASGMPTWVIALLAAALGAVVLLTLNARRTPPVATKRFDAAAVPSLPPALLDQPATPFAPPARASAETLSSIGRWPGDMPFAAPLPVRRDPPFAVDARPSAQPGTQTRNEGAPANYTFRTTPMPGAPTPGGGVTARGITNGATLIFDVGGAAAADDRAAPADGGAVRARLLRNRPAIVAQGEVITATLETPVSSARPGPIRAVVARDVRGFDGSRVLVPRGSRLIGEYRSDPVSGRRRVLATWTRLIRPDGFAIRIDSPATDALGGTGMPGKVDTHFLARFANAALQSALQIAVNLASRAGDGSVIVTNPSQLSSVTGPTIIPGADQPPTVSVPAGASIAVFVARDLDFSGVPVVR